MKIAVTCENDQVFQHFGHTPEFAVFITEGTEITEEYHKSSGDSGHGALAGVLAAENVDLLICGGIGGGAINALSAAGIEVIGGASGSVRQVVEAFLKGSLAVREDFHCHHHDHGEDHQCHGHGGGCGHNCH